MLRSLPSNSDTRIRLLAKFVEKEYEKLSRVVSIRREFNSKISTMEHEIALERSYLSQEEQEERADEWLSRKLDAGLFSLQVKVFFFLFVVFSFSSPARSVKLRDKWMYHLSLGPIRPELFFFFGMGSYLFYLFLSLHEKRIGWPGERKANHSKPFSATYI